MPTTSERLRKLKQEKPKEKYKEKKQSKLNELYDWFEYIFLGEPDKNGKEDV